MRKRVGAGYAASAVFPVLAAAAWMLRLAGPASRLVALALYGLGCLALVAAVVSHPRSRDGVRRGRRTVLEWLRENGGGLVAATAFAAAGWVLVVLVPPGSARATGEVAADLPARLDREAAAVAVSADGILRAVDGQRALFADPSCAVDADRKAQLVRAWSAYLDHSVALDRAVLANQYFYRISPVSHLDLNTRSFLIGYAALVAQLAGAARLVNAVGGVRDVETVLDEPRPEAGVPRGAYFRLKQRLLAPDSALRFHAGRVHLEILEKAGRFRRADEVALLARTHAAHAEVVLRVAKDPAMLVDNPADYFEHALFQAWFPLQKEVSEAMGDIRTTERPPLVSPEAVHALLGRLEPGDVLIERRNWFLSNIGLPGFWPHAALFVGTPEEQDAYFDAAARAPTMGEAPSAYVSRTLPRVAEALRAPGEHGPPRVIEAISEGVSLTSIEHSAGADYVAVLRPRLTRADKLAAVLRAFALHGRPYDFDFDFVTDDAIVCSELVYKAYQRREGGPGLDFTLVRTADRWVLPPNDIVRKFDKELGTPGAQLDFVALLDGVERTHTAVPGTADTLRASWKRPKWDILQE